ncbi:MAG TPA: response regulator [Allosphingosinicella sp.]
MKHALIIEDNLIVSKALETKLAGLGFQSFDHVWTENAAVEAAAARTPDLILVGDGVENGSGIEAARRISLGGSIPVLLVTGDSLRARSRLPQGASVSGPFMLRDIDNAVGEAREIADNDI